ncbi:MAG: PAS domain S-box protein [Mesorhizobium sp.]|nr:MAG: PAS domain S-box protein [Mesorhizobium sp.]
MEIEQSRVLDALPAMVWTAKPDGHVDFVNRRWSEYTGLDLDQVRCSGWQAAIDPKDLPKLIESWRSILASGEPGEMEARMRRVDGQYRWFVIHCSPMRDDVGRIVEWYAINTDIDQRKRAEETLRQDEARLTAAERDIRQTIDTIPVFVATYSPDGTRTFVNRTWQDYMGLTLEDAIGPSGKTFPHFYQDDVERNDVAWRVALESGEPLTIDVRVRRADGQYRWHTSRRVPHRDENGRVIRWYSVGIDIDDQRRAEEALLASRHDLGLIINTIPVMAWSARPDGSPEFFNQHYLHYVGLSIGQSKDWEPAGPLSEYWDLTAAVHPDDVDRLAATWEAILASGKSGEAEARLRRFDGKYRWFLFRANPLRDEAGNIVKWYGTHTDIHGRKRAEDALKRSEAFLSEGQYLARMGNLSWQVATGEVTWSEPLYRIFEFEPGTLVTLERIASRVHPEDLPLMGDMVERALRGDSDFEYQHRILLPDLSVKHLHLIAHRARNDSGHIEYVGAVLDITQRRRSEEALEKVRSELAQATRTMSLGVLTASIAHEVNQPLSGIVTNAGTCLRMLAADPPNVDGARETARRTIRDGNRAADVIARLRALFARRATIVEPIDLNNAAAEVVALFSGDLQRNKVLLQTQLADGLPLVGGDRVQLQQVIMNLLRNASDAMVTVDDRPRLVVLGTRLGEDGKVHLFVRDSGIGFDAQGAERLFEAFYTTKAEGMGIGLSVSRSIVESHGGRLWAEANVGPGSTFSFSIHEYLRAEPSPAHPSGAISAPTSSSASIQRGFS